MSSTSHTLCVSLHRLLRFRDSELFAPFTVRPPVIQLEQTSNLVTPRAQEHHSTGYAVFRLELSDLHTI